MRTHLGTSLALALTLAACSPELGQETAPITVDPTCASGRLKLYPIENYLGTPICLTGNGIYELPANFDTRSYLSGKNVGCFHWNTDVSFAPQQGVPLAPYAVVHAHSVEIINPVLGIDAAPCH